MLLDPITVPALTARILTGPSRTVCPGLGGSDAGALPGLEMGSVPEQGETLPLGSQLATSHAGCPSLWAACRSNRFPITSRVTCPDRAVVRPGVKTPPSATSLLWDAVSGQTWQAHPDRPQATARVTNHDSSEEEDVADTSTPE
jgi:hypothetical protein